MHYAEDHHDVLPADQRAELDGRVCAIHALVHDLEPVTDLGDTVRAAPRSGELVSLTSDGRWECERLASCRGQTFTGWVVEIDTEGADPR